VLVEDTAYVVWSVNWCGVGDAGEEYVEMLLSDNTTERLNPETLQIGKSFIPYCRIKEGRFEARFSRAAYYKLAEHLHSDSANDAYFISLNGRQYFLPQKSSE